MKTARRTGPGFTSPFLPTPSQTANIHRITRSGTLPPNPSSLQATASLAKTELGRYDTEIAKLQTELDRLVSERETLFSYAASCRSVLSARQRLPNEVLVSIFEFCFPHDRYKLGQQMSPEAEVCRISQYHLIQLGQVSFRWHQIAMGTPQLWSSITIDTSIWPRCGPSPQIFLQQVESSLMRSRNHALDLQADIVWRRDYGESVFQLLTKSAHRWKNVRIRSFLGPSVRSARTLGRLEKLETLELELGWKALESLETPRLKHFKFRGTFDALPASFPWNQLETCAYDCDDGWNPATLSVLRTANDSAVFTFRLNLYQEPNEQIMVSSNIRHISFEVNSTYHTDPVRELFDALTLPRLQVFEYRSPGVGVVVGSPTWSSDGFMALAHRSAFATHLIRVSIHARIADEELLGCLAALPCLEELSVFDTFGSEYLSYSSTVVTNQFLQGLLCVPGEAPLVPKLRMLAVTTVMDFTDSVYFYVVVSRIGKIREVDRSGVFDACIRRYPEQRKLTNKARKKLKSLADSGALLFNMVEVK
ncbi:hypothetical protein R3P38DRAFT_2497701 [Favolaschia claudopus]|uniref:F-box domain-containing protein n=1 Tax=Favolaschia claudopus TaxID=2862362 RepID=A0AAW0E5X0_9AGAR